MEAESARTGSEEKEKKTHMCKDWELYKLFIFLSLKRLNTPRQ